MRYLCPSCNKSKHKGCKGGKCECNCQKYFDNRKGIEETRLSDPKLDDVYENINKMWSKL